MRSNRKKCFLCNNSISWNLRIGPKNSKQTHDIKENCVAYHMKGRGHRGVKMNLNEQCKEEEHKLFYFLEKEISRPPSTFVLTQKSMIAGLEICGGVIPYL